MKYIMTAQKRLRDPSGQSVIKADIAANPLLAVLKKFKADTQGNFAVMVSVAAFPILIATSLAIDYSGAEASSNSIKSALDTAVLASVSNNKVDNKGREKIALDVFNAHYNGGIDLDLSVDVVDGKVEMTASGLSEATIARAVGKKGFEINESSVAVMNRENTICVLALSNTGEGKLRFLDETEFKSPTCSVQSNSVDPSGVISTTKKDPVAKSFCSAGGAVGDFFPAMRGQCGIISDPYKHVKVADAGVCMPLSIFGLAVDGRGNVKVPMPTSAQILNGHEDRASISILEPGKHEHPHCHFPNMITGEQNCHVSNHKANDVHGPSEGLRLENIGLPEADIQRLTSEYGLPNLTAPESGNYTVTKGVYYPGTYCGGLTVDGKEVTFLPGRYVIKDGPLTFKNGASAIADDVSFILEGTNSVLTVETNSKVAVKAPSMGPTAGLAFYQSTGSVESGLRIDLDKPSAVNLISSGGELNVTGTMYFPTQALEVIGDSVLGAKAPATSFIAHQVTFAGKTKAEVKVDHLKGGIPPMLPRSDDGARLLR